MKKFLMIFLFLTLFFCSACNSSLTNKPSDEIKKPSFDYNIDYDLPKSFNQNKTSNYDYSDIVYITKTGKCFHKGYCSHAKKSAGYMSRSQAIKKGYRACSFCCY